MKSQQIRWLGAAILMPVLIGLSTASCEDTSIWDVNSMVGMKKSVCKTDIECDDGNECTEDTCNTAGLCEYLVLPNAKSCDDGNVCTVDRCDIYGRCQNELDTARTVDLPEPCRLLSCQFGVPTEIIAPDGYSCTLAGMPANGGRCEQSNCIGCNDGLLNGGETAVDCGGPNCPGCDDGLLCNQNSDCLHGFCVEGLCCNNACDKVCYSCQLSGSVGTCAPVALEQPDNNAAPAAKCTFPYLCDGIGNCKATHGESCLTANDCLSGYCYQTLGICQIDVGNPCEGSPANCYTDHCDANGDCAFLEINAACSFNDQCGPKRFCYESPLLDVCKISEGQICAADNECATTDCAANNTCKKLIAGSTCQFGDQCESGTCFWGSCL